MPVIHVGGGGDYYRDLPGYRATLRTAGPTPKAPEYPEAPCAGTRRALNKMRHDLGFPGKHNRRAANAVIESDFYKNARPLDSELIVQNGHQLNAVCQANGIGHLIYIGFAINWCLDLSPAGMLDMRKYGYMCSTIREATTAVENKESARRELHKEHALWRVAMRFGFVFDLDPFVTALKEI